MKGYVFTYGVDGFGADTAPAHEIGVYLDFDKAFKKLVELNHNSIIENNNNCDTWCYKAWYEKDYDRHNDKEYREAVSKRDWDKCEEIDRRHIITDEIEINKQLINVEEPPYDMYAIEEIEIIE